MEKAPEPISKEEFERICKGVPKEGFCLIGIKYLKGNPSCPKVFVKKIRKTKPKSAIVEALCFILYKVKTNPDEPLRLFQNGKILRDFTGK